MRTETLEAPGSVRALPAEWPRLLAFSFPVRNAVRRWRGMVGMMVGVGLGLGMVLTMMGILGTAMDALMGDFGQSGANVYVVVNGGRLVQLKTADSPGTIDQPSALMSKIRGMPGVQAAVGVLVWPLRQEREGPQARYLPTEFLPAMVVDGDPTQISNLVVLKEGRWLRRGNEVVLGPMLSASKSLRVGNSLRMNGQEYEIVGIGKMRGFGGVGESLAYVDARALRQRGIIGDLANYAAVQTAAPGTVIDFVGDFPALRAVESNALVKEIKSLTALENVALPMEAAGVPARERYERAALLLDEVGLADRLLFMPAQLSGGQRQRVAVARALANDPKLILADEPTGELHSADKATIVGLFRRLKAQGRTVVVVTHDPEVASAARRRIEIRDGRILRDELLTEAAEQREREGMVHQVGELG